MTNKLMPGSDLWFYPGVHELQLLSDQPLAAKATYVHHSGLVNLIVWGKSGATYQRASVPFWDGDGDAPASGSYAGWVDADGWKEIDAPDKADVAHHPFEGRPSGGTEDLDRARVAQSALDARGNMDHGPPRGAPSPYSGGPLQAGEATPAAPGTAPDPAKVEADRAEGQMQAQAKRDADAKAAQAQEARAAASAEGFGDQQAKSAWDPSGPAFGQPKPSDG